MEPLSARALIGQLGDDLGWLEKHCREQPDQATAAVRLRLAAALVRNCVGPSIDDQPPTPLHVVVIGGAGAGKSTVANLLSGAQAAEANPQAGFTRHPIAYTSATGALSWAGHLGFLGPLQRLTNPAPSSLDEDVYQVRRVPADPTTYDLLKDFVVWDCPDMTTWAAVGYIPRLLEAAALADVIVFVASDERYNDEVPTQFLQTDPGGGQAGRRRPDEDARGRRRAARRALPAGSRIAPAARRRRLLRHPVPETGPTRRPGPAGGEVPHPPAESGGGAGQLARRWPAAAASSAPTAFSCRDCRSLLSVARRDLDALEGWQTIVQTGRNEFVTRYHREYLNSEKFRGFDDALVRLMELLELPGIGRILSGTLWVLRTPYRLLRGPGEADAEPAGGAEPAGAAGAGRRLQRLDRHAPQGGGPPRRVASALGARGAGLPLRRPDRTGAGAFQKSMRSFQSCEAEEVERTARDIYEQLEKRPAVLYSLRGGKFALDVAAVAGSIARRRHRPGSGLHHRPARRLADASARRVARLAGGGRPARGRRATASKSCSSNTCRGRWRSG